MQVQPAPVTQALSPLHRRRSHLILEVKAKWVTQLGKWGDILHLRLTRVSVTASEMTHFSCFSFSLGAWGILSIKQPFGPVGTLQTGLQGSLLKGRTHCSATVCPCTKDPGICTCFEKSVVQLSVLSISLELPWCPETSWVQIPSVPLSGCVI